MAGDEAADDGALPGDMEIAALVQRSAELDVLDRHIIADHVDAVLVFGVRVGVAVAVAVRLHRRIDVDETGSGRDDAGPRPAPVGVMGLARADQPGLILHQDHRQAVPVHIARMRRRGRGIGHRVAPDVPARYMSVQLPVIGASQRSIGLLPPP